MDWSKTKTIYIAVFLVLDVFLAIMFFNKYGASSFTVIKETSIEEKLKSDSVQYEELPADRGELSHVTAKSKVFTETEMLFVSNQEAVLSQSGTSVSSTLDKPYNTDGAKREKIQAFVNNSVYQGGQYDYWERNDDSVVYVQKIEGKKLFANSNGMLVLELDEDENITGYTQTMLDSVDESSNEEGILPALDALDALYKNGYIQPGSKIRDAELGYYTLVQLTESQVLSPTWFFRLENGDYVEEVYVNAFEGSIYPTSQET